jgi:hypothetical protein
MPSFQDLHPNGTPDFFSAHHLSPKIFIVNFSGKNHYQADENLDDPANLEFSK